MKTSLLKIAGSIIAALALASAAKATQIQGEIGIVSNGNVMNIDLNANTVTFTSGTNAKVNYTVGDYSAIADGTAVHYSSFTYLPYAPMTIWTINASTYFVLTSITAIAESSGLVLQGYGTAYLTGYDATPGAWSFAASQTTGKFNWSSTNVVPEGGLTAAMLGLGLLGLGLAARRQKRA